MRTRENGGIARWLGGALGIMTLLVLAGDLRAVEFLRADANNDTKVSISDAYFTLSFLFSGGQRPECEETADTNGDGQVNLTDGIATLAFLVMGGDAPAAPFPTPGEHAGPGANLPCDSYGNGAPLEDPAATLAISQVEADGGASRNASITLAVSSTGPIGGLYAEIVDARLPPRARTTPSLAGEPESDWRRSAG